METIQYLIGKIIKLVIGLTLAVMVLWLVGLLMPQFKITNIIKSSGNLFSTDWLPAPKQYGQWGKSANKDTYGNEYVPGPEYNGYQNEYGGSVDWVYKSATSTYVVKSQPYNTAYYGNDPSYSQRFNYIRNISIYDGGSIHYGQTIVGEAKTILFRNGVFPVLITNTKGAILGYSPAVNTGDWAIPGWSRFQFTIQTKLPAGEACILWFVLQDGSRVSMPVRCE